MTRKMVFTLLAVSLFFAGCAGKKVKVAQPRAPSSFELAEKNYLGGKLHGGDRGIRTVSCSKTILTIASRRFFVWR